MDRTERHTFRAPLAIQRRHHCAAPAAVAAPAHRNRSPVDAAIARAAKIGDEWLVAPIPTLDQLAVQMSVFKSARVAAGLMPAEHICRLLEVGCAADEETAVRRTSYLSWGLEGLTFDPNAVPEKQLRALTTRRFAVGAPATVSDMLVAQHHAGIHHLSMRVSWPGMKQDDILSSIEILGRQVLPEVRHTEPLPLVRRPGAEECPTVSQAHVGSTRPTALTTRTSRVAMPVNRVRRLPRQFSPPPIFRLSQQNRPLAEVTGIGLSPLRRARPACREP
jgi:hypothetical protein